VLVGDGPVTIVYDLDELRRHAIRRSCREDHRRRVGIRAGSPGRAGSADPPDPDALREQGFAVLARASPGVVPRPVAGTGANALERSRAAPPGAAGRAGAAAAELIRRNSRRSVRRSRARCRGRRPGGGPARARRRLHVVGATAFGTTGTRSARSPRPRARPLPPAAGSARAHARARASIAASAGRALRARSSRGLLIRRRPWNAASRGRLASAPTRSTGPAAAEERVNAQDWRSRALLAVVALVLVRRCRRSRQTIRQEDDKRSTMLVDRLPTALVLLRAAAADGSGGKVKL